MATRNLYDIYKSRPDLQREFPNWQGEQRIFGADTGGGLSANKQWDINEWWNRHGQKEYPGTELSSEPLTTQETETPVRTLTENPLTQTPRKSSYQIFNSALMDMLKEYQGIGTRPIQERQIDLNTQQAQKVLAESPAGFSPSQQSAMRSSDVSAIQPSIEGARDRQQTFQEQMKSFGNILTATKQYAQEMEESKVKQQENTRAMIQDALANYGSQAFIDIDEKALAELEEEAGYPKGYLARKMTTIKERELSQKTTELDTSIAEIDGRKVLINNQTGDIIKEYGKATGEITSEKLESTKKALNMVKTMTNHKGLSGAVGLPNLQSFIPGSAESDFIAYYNSLKSLLTLENLGLMKGVLSDTDIKILQQAGTELDRRMGEESFKTSLKGIEDFLNERINKANQSGQSGGQSSGTTSGGLNWTVEQDLNEVGSVTNNAQRIASAIKSVESGGNYNAKGGSGEFGAYQFMPSTWSGWAKKYLGDANAKMTPENQDKVAHSKINELLKQGYNAEQIALIWNGGSPTVKKGTNKYGVKYDTGAYAKKVLSKLG